MNHSSSPPSRHRVDTGHHSVGEGVKQHDARSARSIAASSSGTPLHRCCSVAWPRRVVATMIAPTSAPDPPMTPTDTPASPPRARRRYRRHHVPEFAAQRTRGRDRVRGERLERLAKAAPEAHLAVGRQQELAARAGVLREPLRSPGARDEGRGPVTWWTTSKPPSGATTLSVTVSPTASPSSSSRPHATSRTIVPR
jgi:hypothetical protein